MINGFELLLIFCVNLLYLPTLWFGLVTDDALGMALSPYPIKPTKAFNLVVHVLVAEYIYIAFGCTGYAFLAAIVFSVHPMVVQVPVWISGRQYGVNALIFLMVIAYAPWAAVLLPLGQLGCGTLALPILAFAGTKAWPLALAFPFMFWLSWKKMLPGLKGKVHGDGWLVTPIPKDYEGLKFKPKKLILVVKTFWYYILASIYPDKICFYNSYLASFGYSKSNSRYWYSLNRHFWGGVFALSVLFALWVMNIQNVIGFGIMLFVLSVVPFSNFISIAQWTSPRYAYMPLIGFHIALWALLERYFPLEVVALCAAGFFGVYVVKMKEAMRTYRTNNIDMYVIESKVCPDNPRLWYFLYEHWLNKRNPIMAWASATYGLMHLPDDCQLYFGLSVSAFNMGQIEASRQFLVKSEELMIQTDRESMKGYIDDMKKNIDDALQAKWRNPQPQRGRSWPPK